MRQCRKPTEQVRAAEWSRQPARARRALSSLQEGRAVLPQLPWPWSLAPSSLGAMATRRAASWGPLEICALLAAAAAPRRRRPLDHSSPRLPPFIHSFILACPQSPRLPPPRWCSWHRMRHRRPRHIGTLHQ